ncbi:SDR family NAD(P)-dependent oxidoreductase [Burkholderiaceae bacterium DAT-1]|nr:SDR family NAD(P)-dependent oxidoreductase [Burkholderiaceae bacterium DAT-1]
MSFQGRVIAVTGASTGIGLALAAYLGKSGATVLAGARHVPAQSLTGVTFQALDVQDAESTRAFCSRAAQMQVDAFISNAGIGCFGEIETISDAQYRNVMDTNVLGLIHCAQAMAPHFRSRHEAGLHSRLVVVTSDVSARTFAGGALYTASKYAQRAICQSLAYEGQAYGLHVTEIRPGMVDTHFNGGLPGDPSRQLHLQPDDVVSAVAYALSVPGHVRVDEILLHPVVQPVTF